MGQCIICGKFNASHLSECAHCGGKLIKASIEPITEPLLSPVDANQELFSSSISPKFQGRNSELEETLDDATSRSTAYPAPRIKTQPNLSLLGQIATDITLPPQNTAPGIDFSFMQANTSEPPAAQPVALSSLLSPAPNAPKSLKNQPLPELDESFDDVDFMDLDLPAGDAHPSDILLDDSIDLDLDDFDHISDTGTHMQVKNPSGLSQMQPPAMSVKLEGQGERQGENDQNLNHPLHYTLVLLKKAGDAQQFKFNKSNEIIIGRGNVDISLPQDLHLSTRHASFKKDQNQLYLEDLKSLNGTWIKVKGIKSLKISEEFMIGQQIFKIQASPNAVLELSKAPAGIKFSKFALAHVRSDGAQIGLYPLLEGISRIGRYLSDLCFTYDHFMSPSHLAFEIKGDLIEVRDLNSQNGVWLKVAQKVHLQKNDIVRVGQSLIRIMG
jgi:pSer/pThr/pTyr-binding forkhead associated (FHA) protein